ncbi:TolC family protein [Hymenobacter sp. BT188]|uniref:TolC family protein n=1 Tax=Hymenobacter sp. BT188 TaxID=2763504 RepID=UPI0016515FAA|nr:TolC family protein [Hymenobacter sp. BT188]MBC6605973.1 TolC family protein [Hymenobacter sp. BT188]
MKHLFAPQWFAGRAFVLSVALVCSSLLGWAQSGRPGAPAALPANATLEECVQFALRNQPLVRQATIDEAIGERQIRIGLSDWLPQVQGVGSYTRNLILPTTVLPNFQDPTAGQQLVRIGLKNTSTIGLQGTQLLYSNDVLLAARSMRFVRLNNSQNTTAFKIDVVTNVSKAFYDILLTQEQLRILDEAIVRQEKQLKDAFAQYEVGITDKIDYKRASISVKNARAQRKTTAESLKGKYATLKQLMGYAPENNLALAYDTAQMIRQTRLDTTQQLTFENRIEVQQLLTQKKLQRINIDYYRLGFLPSLSGFVNYNRVYQNNDFSVLYDRAFPNSQAGLQLALPIFTGTRRTQNLRIAELQDERLDLDLFDTKNQINSEYEQALATYKSALNDLATQQENARDAQEIYGIVKLQYDEGIKTYLEVIVAETDLRTSQLNYYNSLFAVLASKLDVERALGTIALN